MGRAHEYAEALGTEWGAAQQWADLSCFEGLDEARLLPATQAAAALLEEMRAQLRDETARLQALRRVKEDADLVSALLQSQVPFAPRSRPRPVGPWRCFPRRPASQGAVPPAAAAALDL